MDNLLKKAEDLLNEKEYDEALSYYNEVLKIDVTNVDGLAGRAAVYIETSEHTSAQQDAQNVLIQDPENIQVGSCFSCVSPCHPIHSSQQSSIYPNTYLIILLSVTS